MKKWKTTFCMLGLAACAHTATVPAPANPPAIAEPAAPLTSQVGQYYLIYLGCKTSTADNSVLYATCTTSEWNDPLVADGLRRLFPGHFIARNDDTMGEVIQRWSQAPLCTPLQRGVAAAMLEMLKPERSCTPIQQ